MEPKVYYLFQTSNSSKVAPRLAVDGLVNRRRTDTPSPCSVRCYAESMIVLLGRPVFDAVPDSEASFWPLSNCSSWRLNLPLVSTLQERLAPRGTASRRGRHGSLWPAGAARHGRTRGSPRPGRRGRPPTIGVAVPEASARSAG